jgi:hypothetical protein
MPGIFRCLALSSTYGGNENTFSLGSVRNALVIRIRHTISPPLASVGIYINSLTESLWGVIGQ